MFIVLKCLYFLDQTQILLKKIRIFVNKNSKYGNNNNKT